eukprot:CAMPEP_0196724322 /NCGR_PEP_ID=MMETSP1091-20130531/6221_1 /TAXON_ID=302021 /ORGANISM="Rhodomonas sp., Strain CCMP768" /LENGTH=314 /DNA_ID=CAMNT_0042066431 /DNA_START=204 /DNA_END=1148 /DNA_ORIENTATION=+
MTPTEKYLFDLNGFIVVRGVLTPAQVAAANAAIDAHQSEFKGRTDDSLRNTAKGTPFAGDGTTPRLDMGGMLGWPAPHCDVFRSILAHPKLVPYFRELVGEGYRMDHLPLLIASEKGAEGFALHGGTIDTSGNYTPYLAYHYSHGRMVNNLLACSVQLVDHPAGSGGFVCVRGSHKANFATPSELINGEDELEGCLYQPETKAGDVVLFSEGTVHGAKAWNMDYQRRLVIYRFAPPTVAYARSYYPAYPSEMTDGMTPEQLAVLEPPYNVRLDRPLVKGGEGEGEAAGKLDIEVRSRPETKKKFDSEVFGTKYF